MRRYIFYMLTVCALIAGLSSCDESLVYSNYKHTPLVGWDKEDTLIFCIPPIKENGVYRLELGLRTTIDYPFTSLNVNVEQCILPHHKTQDYKVKCTVMEKNGALKGQGVSFYQYTYPLNDIHLQHGDSVVFRIHHDMKRETLPGIADIGISLIRK